MFVQVLIIIAVISIAWAIWSLKNLSVKKEIGETKEKLKKGRVVYQRTSSSSSS